MDKGKRRKTDHIALFPISVKLVTIVTLIVLVSLGSITALVSWLVRQDLRIAAEENNFEANRRSAAEAESLLSKIRSDTLMLMYTITSVGTETSLAKNNAAYFFRQNPHIAAFFFTIPGWEKRHLVNEQFFLSRNIDLSTVDTFRDNHQATLRRAAAGETLVINATPQFAAHLLAMFIPSETGGAMALFSPESLDASFGSELNQSWMINSLGDIIIHADFEYVRSGVNVSDHNFIRSIQESPDRNKQFLIETDFGVTRSNVTNKNPFYSTWETVQQSSVRLYNICADAICRIFEIERNTPQDKIQFRDEQPETTRLFVAYTKLNIGGCTVITSIGYDKVFEGIAATTRRNIYLTIAVLSFSVMLIWFFSKSISVPLKILAEGARKIEGGKFDLELQKPKGRDEVAVLTISFQKMCSALRIFGRFTNREISIKAMRGQIKPGGLQKHATILFSDIRNFTAKSETFTNVFGEDASDRIVYWLNNYFSRMVDCVEKTNGSIDKFIGDAVMAHWGAVYTSGSPARDAFNGVLTALMMRKAVHEMNKQRRKGDPSNPPINIGCGINTGIVTAGQLGSDMRMEYTIIGDPVNLASRMESLNKPLGTDILISENTWKFVKKYFITEEMPPVTVKGKKRPVRIFAVINVAGTDKGPKTIADVRKLLGIQPPDTSKIDVNADEKKYKIGETTQTAAKNS